MKRSSRQRKKRQRSRKTDSNKPVAHHLAPPQAPLVPATIAVAAPSDTPALSGPSPRKRAVAPLLLATLAAVLDTGPILTTAPSALVLSSASVVATVPVRAAAAAILPRVTRELLPYLKGQTHIHSANSFDGIAMPATIERFYASRGYDFIVFTDHNYVTRAPAIDNLLVIPGVELTQNMRRCDPPIEGRHHFCFAHLNVLGVGSPVRRISFHAKRTHSRLEAYDREISAASGLGGVLQLNHPNFGRPLDSEDVEALSDRGVALFEVMNHAVDEIDAAAADAPPVATPESLWDAVLSSGHTVYGVATDDAHMFIDGSRTPPLHPRHHAWRYTADHGFVMVRARRDIDSILRALSQGQFFASNGVILELADEVDGALEVRVAAQSPGDHRIDFIGPFGRLLATEHGRAARFPLDRLAVGDYVRAVVVGPSGNQAWVQPVWRR